LGGITALLAAFAYVLAGIAFLLDPVNRTTNRLELSETLLRNPTMSLLFHWSLALGALFTVPVVNAVFQLVREKREGVVLWASYLAYLGLSITAISDLRAARTKVSFAETYMAGDETVRTAVDISERATSLDPELWYSFGGVGIWLLVVNWLALRSAVLPRTLAYLGLLAGLLNCLAVAGLALNFRLLNQITAGLGGILVQPAWLVWLGLRVRRSE
jgi:hypothetical protein